AALSGRDREQRAEVEEAVEERAHAGAPCVARNSAAIASSAAAGVPAPSSPARRIASAITRRVSGPPSAPETYRARCLVNVRACGLIPTPSGPPGRGAGWRAPRLLAGCAVRRARHTPG